jgi:hypothetical protein
MVGKNRELHVTISAGNISVLVRKKTIEKFGPLATLVVLNFAISFHPPALICFTLIGQSRICEKF